jgi:nicotinamidase/pyrazinamidase
MRVMIDVDTLNDFFEGGALPVPSANEIRPMLKKLTKLAKDEKIPVLKICDAHDGTEPEMLVNGGMFPLHCLKETEGAATIRETAHSKAIVFEKQTYDVFDKKLGNKNFEKWLTDNKVTESWVYGVATEICVKAAVLGLRKLGITTYVFKDAIKGIDEKNVEKAIQEMKNAGALFAESKI